MDSLPSGVARGVFSIGYNNIYVAYTCNAITKFSGADCRYSSISAYSVSNVDSDMLICPAGYTGRRTSLDTYSSSSHTAACVKD